MTSDPKAPLPDEVENKEKRYGYEHPTDRVGYSLKQLEETVKTASERFEIRKTVVLDLCAHIAAQGNTIALLEASNKRLREVVLAAKHLSSCLEKTNWSSWQTTASFADAHNALDNKLAALAQTGGGNV